MEFTEHQSDGRGSCCSQGFQEILYGSTELKERKGLLPPQTAELLNAADFEERSLLAADGKDYSQGPTVFQSPALFTKPEVINS